jgi:1,4-dihydroxy-2-naphthoate octaprenyltransferase
MHVLIVVGHPRSDSFCGALAASFAEGALQANCEVETLRVGDLAYAPDVMAGSPGAQPLEPDLERARALIAWADHLVLVYPNWWGTMPARFKGFLDRVLLPNFAFREQDGHYYGLLGSRTAELITTMDVPPLVYRWIQGAPGRRAMTRATLGLCGIDTVRTTVFAPVSHSDEVVRRGWIAQARGLGGRLSQGPRSPLQRVRQRASTGLRAIRPQFYPMSLLAYTIGALLSRDALDVAAFALGMICVTAFKIATVLTNDIYDRDSDARNRNWGPFTGGSRSLHEGGLDLAAMWRGARVALAISLLAASALLLIARTPLAVLAVFLPLAVLALGYSVPPLRLSHRGLGELDVALTHGPGVVLFGFVAQGGDPLAPLPWLLGLVIGVAILPAIVLAGVPDRLADAAAGKRSLAVRLGTKDATRLVLALLPISAIGALALCFGPSPLGPGLALVAVPHAMLLSWLLVRYLWSGAPDGRIDGLIAVALLYIGWFVIMPVIELA